ncbi:MAG: metal ABC transporter substrate-binding protein [Actinomycetota bacterium]|nr:metal ABC transporter substrate-binding protein [Actinomycetota bacterium]
MAFIAGRTSALILLTAVGLSACSSAEPSSSTSSDGLSIVATTTMLGSVVGDLAACAGGEVTTLLPNGADPHDFAPSSQQVASLVHADIVIANGLGLEGGLVDALESAKSDGATVYEVAPDISPRKFAGTTTPDPHFWFDMTRMAHAVELIGDQLAVKGGAKYKSCATAEAEKIRSAEQEVKAILASVPAKRRVLVTDHDAFGYFANAYGYSIVGAVIPSGTTLAEPSTVDLAALAKTITDKGVTAIFANTNTPKALATAVAGEVGYPVSVVDLYVDSLGPAGSSAGTYIGYMHTDAQRIAEALKS